LRRVAARPWQVDEAFRSGEEKRVCAEANEIDERGSVPDHHFAEAGVDRFADCQRD